MAENIHAVVGNRQQTSSNNNNQPMTNIDDNDLKQIIQNHISNPNHKEDSLKNQSSNNIDYDDNEDDDIDIIGRSVHATKVFGNNPQNSLNNNQSFQNLSPSSPLFNLLPNQINQQPRLFPAFFNSVFDSRLQTQQIAKSSTSSSMISSSMLNNAHNNVQQLQTTEQQRPRSISQQPIQQQSDINQNSQQNPDSSQQQYSQEWSLSNSDLIIVRNRLRRRLRYHFMSPIDKWYIKGRFPWKLLFQIIKILFVTTQVTMFGNNFQISRSVDNSMLMTLHDLFLWQWDSSRDFKAVPQNIGPYAVYTKHDFYHNVDFAVKNYANITNLAFGLFGYQLQRDQSSKMNNNQPEIGSEHSSPIEMSSIDVCFERYVNVTMNPSLSEYYIEPTIEEKCFQMDNLYPPGSDDWHKFSFHEYLTNKHPDQLNFQSLIQMYLKLPLRVILLNTVPQYNMPQCFDLNVLIRFNNKPTTGGISIQMSVNKEPIDCLGNLQVYNHEAHIHHLMNFIVLFLCSMSLILCARTLFRAQQLRKETVRFFLIAYKRNMETKSSMHFLDGWILMILLNDLLLIVGTLINLLRRFNMIGPHKINSVHPAQMDSLCSAFLGVGLLLVWFGILRYLTFFNQYNILLVTIKHSLSRVLRFILCVLVLYGGFCFSGWIILGPYHWKFSSLARTSECLFALMNGDDVFATFAYLDSSSPFVWWFSRIYLYSYVLLFIYVVLSLFIAILMDSYETIKEYYTNNRHNKNQRNIRIDFTWCNDQLSRFLLAIFDHDDNSDTLSSYRVNLLNDDAALAAAQQGNSNPCCPCRHTHPNMFQRLFVNGIRGLWSKIFYTRRPNDAGPITNDEDEDDEDLNDEQDNRTPLRPDQWSTEGAVIIN